MQKQLNWTPDCKYSVQRKVVCTFISPVMQSYTAVRVKHSLQFRQTAASRSTHI